MRELLDSHWQTLSIPFAFTHWLAPPVSALARSGGPRKGSQSPFVLTLFIFKAPNYMLARSFDFSFSWPTLSALRFPQGKDPCGIPQGHRQFSLWDFFPQGNFCNFMDPCGIL